MNDSRKHVMFLLAFALSFFGIYFILCHFNAPKYNKIVAVYQTDTIRVAITTKPQNQTENKEVSSGSQKININTASKEELMQLKSIGEVRAEAIIEYRENNGRFRDIYELAYVDGITDSIIAENLGKLTV